MRRLKVIATSPEGKEIRSPNAHALYGFAATPAAEAGKAETSDAHSIDRAHRTLMLRRDLIHVVGFRVSRMGGLCDGSAAALQQLAIVQVRAKPTRRKPTITGYIGYCEKEANTPHAEGEEPTADLRLLLRRAPRLEAGPQRNDRAHRNSACKRLGSREGGRRYEHVESRRGPRPATAFRERREMSGLQRIGDTFFRGLRNVREGDVVRVVTTRWNLSVQGRYDENRLAEECRGTGSYGRSHG